MDSEKEKGKIIYLEPVKMIGSTMSGTEVKAPLEAARNLQKVSFQDFLLLVSIIID